MGVNQHPRYFSHPSALMARYVLAVVALVQCSACDRVTVQKSAPVAQERFVRSYLRALRDSGPPAVLARTKPSS